jgi:hypothetical protein
MVKFSALVCYEGSRRGPGASFRIAVPAPLRDLAAGFHAPGWTRLTVNGCTPFYAFARRPASRATVEITLPHWRLPDIRQGETVRVAVEPAERFCAAPAKHVDDWLPFVLREHYFPVADDNTLALWNQHSEPFLLSRAPADERKHWWLIGFYQAEGSKGQTAADFSAANTNPLLLARMVDALAAWGITRERLYMSVLHRTGTPAAPAVKIFEPLDVTITSVSAQPKNDATGVLRVYQSMPLMRTVRERLRRVFADGFPSKQAAHDYALGWLDGDGSITIGRTSDELRLAGHADEHEVLKRALVSAFGWSLGTRGRFRNTDDGTVITLQPHEMLDLLDAHAFACSMNRVRLLLAFGARSPVDVVESGQQRYAHAIALARAVRTAHPELFGKKCAAYPPELAGL